jgi:UDP-glucose 4-epimerase
VKRAIVTGATGFVGACLARRLLHDGHDVHLLVRPAHRPWRIAPIRADVRLHVVDFGDEAALRQTVAGIRPDWIFHLAAHGAYSSQRDPHAMVRTNVLGTLNLVEAGLRSGFAAFVNTGSSSEYGWKDHAPAESEALEPNSHYAITKATATWFCRHTARARAVHLPTLRLYSVYGPWEEPTRLIPALVMLGLEGQLPPLVSPTDARDYVYSEDVVDAYLLAATTRSEEPGAIYNVGSGVQTPLRDLVELARRVLAVEAEPQWGSYPDRAWNTDVWVADNRKIQRELGWHPRHTLEDGFRATVAWLREHPDLLATYRSMREAPRFADVARSTPSEPPALDPATHDVTKS